MVELGRMEKEVRRRVALNRDALSGEADPVLDDKPH